MYIFEYLVQTEDDFMCTVHSRKENYLMHCSVEMI